MTYWQEWTRAQFDAIETVVDPRTNNEWWDSLVLLPTRRKHDSGYTLFTVIGVRKDNADDPEISKILTYDVLNLWEMDEFISIDCLYPSQLFRVFAMDREISYHYGRVRARKRTEANT